jgi:hypothetical protein
MLPFGGLHVKQAVQRGNLDTNSAFALGSRKLRKNLIKLAGRRTFRMQLTSSQQSGIKYANPIWLLLYLEKCLYICFDRLLVFYFLCAYCGRSVYQEVERTNSLFSFNMTRIA